MTIDLSGIGATSGTHAVSGASWGAPPQQKMSNLFDSIDTGGAGSITNAQFDQAFQARNPPAVFQLQGAGATFAALDPNGTGSVSKPDFVAGMSRMMVSLRAEAAGTAAGPATPSPTATLAASTQALNQVEPSAISPNAPPGSLFNLST